MPVFAYVCVCVCVVMCRVCWGDSVHANIPLVFPYLYVCHLTFPKTHLNTVFHLASTCDWSPSLSHTHTHASSLYSRPRPLSNFL